MLRHTLPLWNCTELSSANAVSEWAPAETSSSLHSAQFSDRTFNKNKQTTAEGKNLSEALKLYRSEALKRSKANLRG